MATDEDFDWEVRRRGGGRRGVAVAYRCDDDGYLIAYTFATLSTGVADLAGVTIEWCGQAFAVDRATEIADRAIGYHRGPGRGLTSRQVRTATAHSGLLAKARRQLAEELHDWVFPDQKVKQGRRDDGLDDRFYAGLVVEYATLIGTMGKGARGELARRRIVPESTLRNWLSEAKRRGLWATSGPGKAGQPTPRAFDIARKGTP
jgi:hypothetical protein